jgi:hypothetical protein
MKSCCTSYQHLKPERWPEVLGKDGNAGHCVGIQKYGISATVCAVLHRDGYFTTDVWVKCPVPKHIYSVQYSKQQNCKFPKRIGWTIESFIRFFGSLIDETAMNNEYSKFLYLFQIKLQCIKNKTEVFFHLSVANPSSGGTEILILVSRNVRHGPSENSTLNIQIWFHPFYRPRRPLGRVEVRLYSVFRPWH